MIRMAASTLTLTFALTLMPIAARADTLTPTQQYREMMKAYNPASGGLRSASNDAERKTAVEQLAPFASKFADLAGKNPNDPIALAALRQAVQADASTDSAALQVWEMSRSDFPAGSDESVARRTVAIVLRDHVRNAKLGPIIDRMRYGYRMDYGNCLQSVLETNTHHEVQGLACLALAQNLNDRLRMIQLVKGRPELSKCYERVFGNSYLPQLQKLDQTKLAARVKKLFERAAREFGDVKFRQRTVGEVAKSELYEIRHLSVGQLAPDIKGKDQNGSPFKLSDYRGKVVLIYFWSEF